MRITTIRTEGLAALSYFVSSNKKAIVIDPRRDALVYANLAKESNTKITHIFETHRNEDYVTGSIELQSYVPDAEIGHSKETKFGYGDLNLSDEEEFKIGDLKVTCLNTPGHTDDSMCYVVTDSVIGHNSAVMFTGDTLFVNEVGRTDLVDITKHEQMSRKLYNSLHEKILIYDDDVTIHPGHGAGSVCGGAIGEEETSTIGFEKKNNVWLAMDEDEFVRSKVNQRLTRSSYFKRCEKLNTIGAPLLSTLKPLQEFEINEYETLLTHPDHRAIDTRPSADFLDSHIPGSLSMTFPNIGLHAGWVLRSNQTFSFILNAIQDLDLAKNSLYRVGLDNVIGYLKGGFAGWDKGGKQVDSISTISSEDLNDALKRNNVSIFDVREFHEYEQERIPTSKSSPLTRMEEEDGFLGITEKIVTVCPSGFRSTTAASIMNRQGINDVAVLLTGLKKWKSDGYSMEQ